MLLHVTVKNHNIYNKILINIMVYNHYTPHVTVKNHNIYNKILINIMVYNHYTPPHTHEPRSGKFKLMSRGHFKEPLWSHNFFLIFPITFSISQKLYSVWILFVSTSWAVQSWIINYENVKIKNNHSEHPRGEEDSRHVKPDIQAQR